MTLITKVYSILPKFKSNKVHFSAESQSLPLFNRDSTSTELLLRQRGSLSFFALNLSMSSQKKRKKDREAEAETERARKRMAELKVVTISRMAQWRVESFEPSRFKTSHPFKVGIWNWHIAIEKNLDFGIRLYPEPSRVANEQPPIAKFIIRVWSWGCPRTPYVSSIHDRLLRSRDDFVWHIDSTFTSRFTIEVEFMDLKIFPINGGDASSIWPTDGQMKSLATQNSVQCLSRMLEEAIHADVTINTADGSLRAHKAVLAASSPVFQSMFIHNLKEKESSSINIEDMSLESCTALLSCLYGTIKQEDFWKHRLALLGAANKYDISQLKDSCEESLLDDINTGNVLERLQEAWLYQLNNLKRGCLTYLFVFGKVHDISDEITNFCRQADRELMTELFQEVLAALKPA